MTGEDNGSKHANVLTVKLDCHYYAETHAQEESEGYGLSLVQVEIKFEYCKIGKVKGKSKKIISQVRLPVLDPLPEDSPYLTFSFTKRCALSNMPRYEILQQPFFIFRAIFFNF